MSNEELEESTPFLKPTTTETATAGVSVTNPFVAAADPGLAAFIEACATSELAEQPAPSNTELIARRDETAKAMAPAAQKPTRGRIVDVLLHGETVPALITAVHSDTCVNAVLFGARPNGVDRMAVYYAESISLDASCFANRSWAWPKRV